MPKGSCLCGAVRFEVEGDFKDPVACHCTRCRKLTGHYDAATEVAKVSLTIEGQDNLTWYQSSGKVRRGFCTTCGAHLLFDPARDWISVAMGAFDAPTGTTLALHIFVADKGDYYALADGVPQTPQ
ncbi:GFA family protein [Rhizobium halophytocola]|uniref:CENP-V/GFA domain-containing protein n=1 Tax=Rhizobium halophytocola TaxID=735519 RepID=A0ABS4DWR7_9HYPH|nr:GFA family protein [Rhizobium halophytocola]MBP1850120.1 hypothetical protein [Rhizobium halophytocola]